MDDKFKFEKNVAQKIINELLTLASSGNYQKVNELLNAQITVIAMFLVAFLKGNDRSLEDNISRGMLEIITESVQDLLKLHEH